MRLLGATPWQSVVAAFAVAFMNGESRWGAGNAGTFQVGLYTQTWALAAFPLALGYGARWMRERKGLAPAIAWSAFVGAVSPVRGHRARRRPVRRGGRAASCRASETLALAEHPRSRA